MSDQMTEILARLAAQASSTEERLSRLLEIQLRPAMEKFVRSEVLKHGGPSISQVTEAMAIAFGRLMAEALGNAAANGVDVREIKKLKKWLDAVFSVSVHQSFSQISIVGAVLHRPDA